MVVLSRNMNSHGVKVHYANDNEFVHLTIHKCRNLDMNEYQMVDREVNIRICIGENNAALHKKMTANDDSIEIKNLPVYAHEEIWMSSDAVNQYCVYGFVTKKNI